MPVSVLKPLLLATKRDKVAELVEQQMRQLAEEDKKEFLIKGLTDGRVSVSLDGIGTTGETQDIAVIRLANALLSETVYEARMTSALSKISELFIDQIGPGKRAGTPLSGARGT